MHLGSRNIGFDARAPFRFPIRRARMSCPLGLGPCCHARGRMESGRQPSFRRRPCGRGRLHLNLSGRGRPGRKRRPWGRTVPDETRSLVLSNGHRSGMTCDRPSPPFSLCSLPVRASWALTVDPVTSSRLGSPKNRERDESYPCRDEWDRNQDGGRPFVPWEHEGKEPCVRQRRNLRGMPVDRGPSVTRGEARPASPTSSRSL
jgi:hypothetical protein